MYDTVPSISTCFSLSGRDCDASAITATIGLQPTRIWRQMRGELIERKDIESFAWMYEIAAMPFWSIDDALQPILKLFWPARARIHQVAIAHGLQCQVSCGVRIEEDRPLYELSADSLRRLSEMGASFLMDLDL